MLVIVVLVVVVLVVVSTSAGVAVVVLVSMIVGMRMLMVTMMVMVIMMSVMMTVVVVTVIVPAIVDAALRLKRAIDRACRAPLSAHQFRQHRIVMDVNGVGRNFGERVTSAEMPGEAHEAQGVLGLHFEKRLRSGLHLDETPVLESKGVAVIDRRVHIEIDDKARSVAPREVGMTLAAARVVEGHRIDDAIRLDGRFADDCRGAGHGFLDELERFEVW